MEIFFFLGSSPPLGVRYITFRAFSPPRVLPPSLTLVINSAESAGRVPGRAAVDVLTVGRGFAKRLRSHMAAAELLLGPGRAHYFTDRELDGDSSEGNFSKPRVGSANFPKYWVVVARRL